jgi:HK97 family phage prohead protease
MKLLLKNEVKTMNENLEQRSYNFEIRTEHSDEGVGIVRGRPIVYNSRTDLGYFDEIIEAGALNGTDLRDVRFLVNHDISKIPLARSRNNNANSTMQLMPDDQGMQIRVNLDVLNNSDARNLYSAIERGDISGMSFMFAIDDEEWTELDSDHPTRHIKRISNVIEVSAVTFPAYEDTEISVRNKKALESAKSTLDSVKRSLDSDLKLAKAKFEALMKVR